MEEYIIYVIFRFEKWDKQLHQAGGIGFVKK